MTMRIAMLKDYKEFSAGFEGFINRTLGRNLCQQKIAVPWVAREEYPEWKALKKKPKRKNNKKKAVSKKAETREQAITT